MEKSSNEISIILRDSSWGIVSHGENYLKHNKTLTPLQLMLATWTSMGVYVSVVYVLCAICSLEELSDGKLIGEVKQGVVKDNNNARRV